MTPLFEARRSVDIMNEQRTSYGTEDQHSSFTTNSCLESSHLSSEKTLDPYPLCKWVLQQAGRHNTGGFYNFKILYMYLEFYLV